MIVRIRLRIAFVAIVLALCCVLPVKADQDDQQIKQQEIVDETANLVANTPTGFTYIFKSGVHNVKATAQLAAKMVLHPIDTAINVTSSIGGTARNVAANGLKKGYNMVRHPFAIPCKLLSLICHPIRGAKDFLSYCDHIDFYKFPFVGSICDAIGQFNGLVPITADNCPELYALLQETAQKLGVEINRVYLFRGNFLTNLDESLGAVDFSCNAYQAGMTTGMSCIVIGKDLLLGVNRGGDSFVPGLSLDEFQAIFAHELTHQKNKHVLKLTAAYEASFYVALLLELLAGYASVAAKQRFDHGENILLPAAGFLVSLGLAFAVPLLVRAYSRRCEKEADMNAANTLQKEEELAAGLVKLSQLFASKHRPLVQLFSTHPDMGTRLGYLRQAARQRKQAELQTQSSDVNK